MARSQTCSWCAATTDHADSRAARLAVHGKVKGEHASCALCCAFALQDHESWTAINSAAVEFSDIPPLNSEKALSLVSREVIVLQLNCYGTWSDSRTGGA